MPYNMLQSAFDALYPAGLQWYWRADFFEEISDEAIAVHERVRRELPTGHSTMHLYPIDGAAARVAEDATAFPYRVRRLGGRDCGRRPGPGERRPHLQWTKDYWTALHPTSAGGGYVNFMMEEGEDRVKAAYRDNYARLARVKRGLRPATTPSTSTRTSSRPPEESLTRP